MRFLDSLQQKVGFTRTEAIAILALSGTFLAGLGIRSYLSAHKQQNHIEQQFDYSKVDSAYAARSGLSVHDSVAKHQTHPLPSAHTAAGEVFVSKVLPARNSIDINTATKSQLMNLPGIGASFAERIIEYRKIHGAFASANDLSNIKGIGKKKLEKLRPFVRVK
jgi:competence ComEA-like helix-hairpin-helix protein